jgi:hypothetical protein
MMYLAAAVCLWYLKAWKIGQLEKVTVAATEATNNVSPVRDGVPGTNTNQGMVAVGSPFLDRLFRLQKV